jgi:hypothetical protein
VFARGEEVHPEEVQLVSTHVVAPAARTQTVPTSAAGVVPPHAPDVTTAHPVPAPVAPAPITPAQVPATAASHYAPAPAPEVPTPPTGSYADLTAPHE